MNHLPRVNRHSPWCRRPVPPDRLLSGSSKLNTDRRTRPRDGGMVLLVGLFMISCALGCPRIALAQTLKTDARLLDQPSGTPAGPVHSSGKAVKLVKRQGFWVQVDIDGQLGWLKLGEIQMAGGGGSVAIDTGRLGQGNIVATSAARGLSSKDLLSGAPDFDAVGMLSQVTQEPASLKAFRETGLLESPAQRVSLVPPQVSAQRTNPAVASPAAQTGQSTAKGPKGAKDDDW